MFHHIKFLIRNCQRQLESRLKAGISLYLQFLKTNVGHMFPLIINKHHGGTYLSLDFRFSIASTFLQADCNTQPVKMGLIKIPFQNQVLSPKINKCHFLQDKNSLNLFWVL